MKIKILICSIFFLSFLACTGIHRTSYDQWERKSFPKLGFSIELPKGCIIQENPVRNFNFNQSLSIRLHDYRPGVLQEGRTVIYIEIIVATKDDLEKYTGKELSFFSEGIGTIHNTITEYQTTYKSTTIPVFRKDYISANGGALLCGANFFTPYLDNQKDTIKDIIAINRILNSIKPLDVKQEK